MEKEQGKMQIAQAEPISRNVLQWGRATEMYYLAYLNPGSVTAV